MVASLLVRMRIAQPEFIAGLVVFALDGEAWAALIETEYFIRQVQACNDELQSVIHAKTTLRVDLGMRIEVNVTPWTFNPERHRGGGSRRDSD